MNEREDFEDIIASKFEEAEFPFLESNWDAAEAMIDAHRMKEKRRRFAFVLSAGILIGVLIMLPFVTLFDSSLPKGIAEVEVPTDETLENTTITDTKKDLKEEIQDEIESTKVEVREKIATAAVEVDKAIKRKETSSEANTVNPKKLLSFNTPTENFEVENADESTGENENTIADVVELIHNKLQVHLIAESTPDSLFGFQDNIDFENNNGKLSLPWQVSLNLGANLVKDFSLNPIQGIEVEKPINSKIALGSGASYTYLTLESGTAVKKITTSVNYTFGYESDVTEIKTNKIHYVVVPAYVKYSLNENNAFIAGVNSYFLFTSSNLVTKYQESYGAKEIETTEKTAGYSSGINNYDAAILLGYKRRLFGNFGVGIYFNFGLMDIKKDDYYQEVNFDRNVSGQFMLNYKF